MTETAKKYALKKFSKDTLNCIHYCAVGGHLWFHSPGIKNGVPNCPYRTTDGPVNAIRFFRMCNKHFKSNRSAFADSDSDFD